MISKLNRLVKMIIKLAGAYFYWVLNTLIFASREVVNTATIFATRTT